MKVRRPLFCLVMVGLTMTVHGQYFQDAFRFSSANYGLGSTARMQAIGGAQIALGGDISSASSNPAGLGFFNKSVFVVTPSLDFINATTDYDIIRPNESFSLGTGEETFKNNFNFANIGAVIHFGKGRYTDDKFKGGSLAISLSRSNRFHLDRSYEGANDYNSIIDGIIQGAGSLNLDELSELEFAAFDQFLITPTANGYGAFVGGFPIQNERIEQRGSHYQFNAAYGGNYDDRLYFGGGMGVQFLNYRQNRTFSEFDYLQQDLAVDSLNSIRIDDEIRTRGIGVNFNVGAIYRPVEFLTIGISYTSPTFLSLDEESFLDLDADWEAGATFTEEIEGELTTFDLATIDPYQSELFVNEYRLRTPSRLGVGAALFVGKSGFLSGDIELVDYGSAQLNSNDFSTTLDNEIINADFGRVVNVRAGGEYRIENFRFRAGYAFFPDPIANSSLQDRTNITFGFGYRTYDYFLDFAVVSSFSRIQAVPYFIDNEIIDSDLAGQPTATSSLRNTTVSVTFGLNF